MLEVLAQLRQQYPNLTFSAGKTFAWSPETREIFYVDSPSPGHGKTAVWSLLHETGHALLDHQTYEADFELLQLEVAAWKKAQQLAQELQIAIDEDHIQDCLDTYRDWLHARSVCPTCTTRCLQQSMMRQYRCHNCHTTWNVTPSRFCRAYRSVGQQSPQSSKILAVE